MIVSNASTFVAHEKVIIGNLVVILVTATAVSLLFQRLRLAIIPAFIVAGVLAGPSVFGFSQSVPALEEIAHLAVVLLLFGVGMELHLASLRTGLWRLLAASIGSILLTIGLLWPIGIAFGLSTVQGAVAAMALSLSSTAVVLRTLSLRRELSSSHGQLSLAILVAQDLAVLGMLASIPIVASWGGHLDENASSQPQSFVELLSEASVMLVGIALLVILSQKLVPTLLREALRDRSGELPLLAGVATALLTAFVAQELGFSLEMGAFIAGFVLASSPFKYHLAGRMNALRDLFMAVFFTTLGMELKIDVLLQEWVLIIFATLGLLALKAGAISLSAWSSGISARLAVRAGLSLAQAGEFSLILLSHAASYAIFDETTTSVIIAIVVLSLTLTPTIFYYAPNIYSRVSSTWLAPWFSTPWQGENTADETKEGSVTRDVVIAGFGPLGQQLAARLEQCGVGYYVVELNPDTVKKEQADNRPIVFGDISNEQILGSLPIESSSVLALTFPESRTAVIAATVARKMAPNLFITARAATHRGKQSLIDAGVDHVIVDEDASANEMFSVVAPINDESNYPTSNAAQ